MKRYVAVEEASELIAGALPPPCVERHPLAGAAGLRLAEDLKAREDQPPFDSSAMDGYAVRAKELAGASRENPRALALAGEIAAGSASPPPWPAGSCLRIFTGAPLPPGADGVVPVEETEELDGGASVRFFADLDAPRAHVRPAGEDLRAGETLLARGQVIDPPAVALLAAQGIAHLAVHPRPKVAFLATGDELVPHHETPGPGGIRNSNGPLLGAQLRRAGFDLLDLGIAPDDRAILKDALAGALETGDVLITSGGVSMGRHDLVGELLAELGARWIFHKVRQKPAKPLAFLLWRDKPVFGLPGNPVSGFMATWYYVIPALKRMMGDPEPGPRRHTARLRAPVRGQREKSLFLRARSERIDGALCSEAQGPHGSHILGSLARSNSFILLPPGTREIAAGEEVQIAFFEEGPC